MPKTPSKAKAQVVKDYFKLPFEVYYSGPLDLTCCELRGNIGAKHFRDVKAAHLQQGQAWGVTFVCTDNRGSELFCCIRNLHEELCPEWLSYESEDEMEISSGTYYAVEVQGNFIHFVDAHVEGVNEMEGCYGDTFIEYAIDSMPDYIILDAFESRIKVDCDGYQLDGKGNRVGTERVFDPDQLDDDALSNYTTRDLHDALSAWVNAVLATQFPNETELRLAYGTD